MNYKLRKSMLGILAFSLTSAAFTFTGCGWYAEKKLKEGNEAYKSKDYEAAFKCFEAAAKTDNAEAQYMLGRCYCYGHGIEKNNTEAVQWFKKAADQDSAKAFFTLANFYVEGKGDIEKDEDKAESLAEQAGPGLKKEAEGGDAEAQHMLGACYLTGLGIAKDSEEGVKWFKKAADKDFAEAQHELGICYMTGQGVEVDMKEGVKWFSRAAEQGYAEAQSSLAICYSIGSGVKKDEEEGVKWFKKAADQGLAYAQYQLGLSYALGQGVEQDMKESVKWLKKAAELGMLYFAKLPEPLPRTARDYEYRHEPVDLLRALAQIYSRGGRTTDTREIIRAVPGRITYSVRDKSRELIARLRNKNATLRELYASCTSRSEVVATFISVLELCSNGSVRLRRRGKGYSVEFLGGREEEILEKIVE